MLDASGRGCRTLRIGQRRDGAFVNYGLGDIGEMQRTVAETPARGLRHGPQFLPWPELVQCDAGHHTAAAQLRDIDDAGAPVLVRFLEPVTAAHAAAFGAPQE